jgi:hypothetical protein
VAAHASFTHPLTALKVVQAAPTPAWAGLGTWTGIRSPPSAGGDQLSASQDADKRWQGYADQNFTLERISVPLSTRTSIALALTQCASLARLYIQPSPDRGTRKTIASQLAALCCAFSLHHVLLSAVICYSCALPRSVKPIRLLIGHLSASADAELFRRVCRLSLYRCKTERSVTYELARVPGPSFIAISVPLWYLSSS